MVKLTITSVSFILTAISALVSASPAKKGVVTVVVGQIFHDTNVLQNDVSSIGKHITFKKALTVNKDIQAVQQDLDNGTSKIANINGIRATEAANIVDQISSMVPTVENILNGICAKRPVLKALPVKIDSLARHRLTRLSDSADRFLAAISIIIGGNGGELIIGIQSTLSAAFQDAISCYGG